jgi:hypothetical protein
MVKIFISKKKKNLKFAKILTIFYKKNFFILELLRIKINQIFIILNKIN